MNHCLCARVSCAVSRELAAGYYNATVTVFPLGTAAANPSFFVAQPGTLPSAGQRPAYSLSPAGVLYQFEAFPVITALTGASGGTHGGVLVTIKCA